MTASTGSAPLASTIAASVDYELVVKKSRFLAHLEPVASVDQADAVVARIRKSMWDARHHCTALIVGAHADAQRSNDDGEPSGTAGIPMLEVLRHRGLTDVVAVVTRYFGGVLLGAGGLVRAYSTAVSSACDAAQIVRREVLTSAQISVGHAEAGRIDNVLRDWASTHGAVLGEPDYAAEATFTLWVPPAELGRLRDDLAAASSGMLVPQIGDSRIVDVV